MDGAADKYQACSGLARMALYCVDACSPCLNRDEESSAKAFVPFEAVYAQCVTELRRRRQEPPAEERLRSILETLCADGLLDAEADGFRLSGLGVCVLLGSNQGFNEPPDLGGLLDDPDEQQPAPSPEETVAAYAALREILDSALKNYEAGDPRFGLGGAVTAWTLELMARFCGVDKSAFDIAFRMLVRQEYFAVILPGPQLFEIVLRPTQSLIKRAATGAAATGKATCLATPTGSEIANFIENLVLETEKHSASDRAALLPTISEQEATIAAASLAQWPALGVPVHTVAEILERVFPEVSHVLPWGLGETLQVPDVIKAAFDPFSSAIEECYSSCPFIPLSGPVCDAWCLLVKAGRVKFGDFRPYKKAELYWCGHVLHLNTSSYDSALPQFMPGEGSFSMAGRARVGSAPDSTDVTSGEPQSRSIRARPRPEGSTEGGNVANSRRRKKLVEDREAGEERSSPGEIEKRFYDAFLANRDRADWLYCVKVQAEIKSPSTLYRHYHRVEKKLPAWREEIARMQHLTPKAAREQMPDLPPLRSSLKAK